jgi:hypothetical protein
MISNILMSQIVYRLLQGLFYLIWVMIGVLVMRKLDNLKEYQFRFLMVLLLLINLTIILISVYGETSFLWPFVIIPFVISYLSGLIYFVFKGTY